MGNQFPGERAVAAEAITWVRSPEEGFADPLSDVRDKTGRSGVPGAPVGAGSTFMRPGRRIVAGETLWEPLNPPHPETRAEAARMHKTPFARNR